MRQVISREYADDADHPLRTGGAHRLLRLAVGRRRPPSPRPRATAVGSGVRRGCRYAPSPAERTKASRRDWTPASPSRCGARPCALRAPPACCFCARSFTPIPPAGCALPCSRSPRPSSPCWRCGSPTMTTCATWSTISSRPMLPVLALSAWGGWSKRVAAAPWVLAGILVSLVAALVQQGRVTLHPQFDHSNLFRVIQMIAMYFLFRAGLGDARPARRGRRADRHAGAGRVLTAGRPVSMRGGELRNLGPHGFHRTRYWEWGDPANPQVVICVHGLTRNGRDFDVLAQALAPYFRVICPDVVGRGRSDWLAHKAGLRLSAVSVGSHRADRTRRCRLGAVGRHVHGRLDRHDAGCATRQPDPQAGGQRRGSAGAEGRAGATGPVRRQGTALQRSRPVRGVPAAGVARPSARSPMRSGGISPRPRRSATTTAPSARRTIPESRRPSQAS